jgi:hypothetical protein
MSDSSFIAVSRHRSALSSSLLSGSSGFGKSGGGHSFVPPGRSTNLDLIDDAWCQSTLPASTIDLTHLEYALPSHLTEADNSMPSSRSSAGDTSQGKSAQQSLSTSSAGIGDAGFADSLQGYNRFVNGGFFGIGEVYRGGSKWGGQGPRGTEEIERWAETGMEGFDQ